MSHVCFISHHQCINHLFPLSSALASHIVLWQTLHSCQLATSPLIYSRDGRVFRWSLSLQECRAAQTRNRMEVFPVSVAEPQRMMLTIQQTSRLHCSVCCLADLVRYSVPASAFTIMSRTEQVTGWWCQLCLNSDSSLRTHTRVHTGGMGVKETEAEGDLQQLVAHWPQNKKALGLKKWVYGTAVCEWWCEIECLGQCGIYCVFNQLRLSVISVLLVFLLKYHKNMEL